MDFRPFAFPALVLLMLTSAALLLSQNWRWSIIALAAQYFGVFVLTLLPWSVGMAATKLISGWIACSVLWIGITEAGTVRTESWKELDRSWPSGRIFRMLAVLLVMLIVPTIAPHVSELSPALSLPQAWAGLVLIGLGLLQLGFTAHPLRVVAGLLTILSGFEIIYAVVESSLLVAGLLSMANLGLAITGAYLIMVPMMEETG
ncbi:MAG: hypothetical protein EHM41_06855 [Chloroflexi bacterium]|nr:MAG: hypothetical protein EHM41_06855 [Chloroflexota bacterium]